MFNIRSITFVLLSVVWLVCQACTYLTYHTFSAPVIGREHRLLAVNGVLLQLEGMDVEITIENIENTFSMAAPYPLPPFIPIWSKVSYTDPLMVKIQLDVRQHSSALQGKSSDVEQTTPDEVSFNPMQVSVESNGKILLPHGFYNSKNRQVAPGPSYWCTRDDKMQTSDEAIVILSKACFWMEFDRPSSPALPFVLRTNGIKRNEQSVTIPTFLFQENSSWVGGTIP